MRIYLRSSALYGFNWQRAFGARYMAKNHATSQEHQKHDESNMKHKRNALAKG